MNLDIDLTPFTLLNVKHTRIKLLEDNIGKSLGDLGFDNAFLHKAPKI